MLEFPRWKYVVILIVLALSALYALPNIYQKDPAVQITANRGGQIDDALRDRVLADLKKAGITPVGAEKEGESLIVRLPDLKAQSAASDALRDTVGENYTVALNLASTVPDWLAKLGGRPMVLGRTCRAACISCCRSTRRLPSTSARMPIPKTCAARCATPAFRTSRWNAVPTTASWPT